MKTKPSDSLRKTWLLLTEVPGWPDAPWWPRLRRSLVIVLPCIAALVVAVWTYGIQGPRFREQQRQVQPLISLEQEISLLQITSDQQVAELVERVAAVSRTLLDSPQDLPPLLKSLKKEALERGWEATFVAADTSGETLPENAIIAYLPVRAKLVPTAENTEPFSSLLAVLERLSSVGKRIDLMRVAIRADEQKWHPVELNFRVVCPVSHEKTP